MKNEKMFSKLIVILLFLCSATYFQAYAEDKRPSTESIAAVLPCPKPVHIVIPHTQVIPPAPYMVDFFTPVPPLTGYNGLANKQLYLHVEASIKMLSVFTRHSDHCV